MKIISKIFDFNTLQLLRIPFSFFLTPVYFFAISQVEEINFINTLLIFFCLHLFIYPASNGYNSYMDQDESSIGGLKHPPKPTKKLFYVSMIFDGLGLIIAFIVHPLFFISVLLYILASRAYSFKGIRLKKYPVTGFLTVIFFQGGFTFWMVFNGAGNQYFNISPSMIPVFIGCSLLIAGVYPLTQIYQHKADKESGDITISLKLGYTGTFIFTACMFFAANFLFYKFFNDAGKLNHFILFQAFLLPVIIYFLYWFIKVFRDINEASFENTMKMNFIASSCMNACFITFLLIRP